MTRLILFLIRLKLGVKKLEYFKFSNQKSPTTVYFFNDTKVMKLTTRGLFPSDVPLNWLLDSECKIVKAGFR